MTDKETDRQTDTSTDNKGRLELSGARTHTQQFYCSSVICPNQ